MMGIAKGQGCRRVTILTELAYHDTSALPFAIG